MLDWINPVKLIVGAVAGAIVGAILRWWSAFRQGMLKQQAEDQAALIEKEHDVIKAVDAIRGEAARDFYLDADGRVHRVRGQRPAPDLRSGPEPPT